VLGGAERGEALAHIDQCGQCRTLVSELTHAGELIPLLAREEEPPSGFENRVLEVFGGRRRRGRWRWIAIVAATAAAAAIVSVATVRMVDRGRDDDAVVAKETTLGEMRAAPMIGPADTPVGWAFASDGRPAAIAVTVDYLLPSGEYTIEAVDGDGDPVKLGTVTVTDGRGVWWGTTKASARGLAVVSLVAADGTLVCTAALV
jgi:hypothetical protein